MRHEAAQVIFQENIKKYLKRAKLKQLYLATLLGVTSSAVCQMLKCRIIMSRNQLQTVCKGLKLSMDETLELQTLLANIRNGTSDLRSPFNKLMKTYRRENNLQIAQLSQMTGISRIRLKSFENDFNAVFTEEDAEKLAKVYDCSADFLMKKYNFINTAIVEYTNEELRNNPILEVADKPIVHYNELRQVHLAALADFSNYSNNVDLFVFGEIRSTESIRYEIEKNVVGITAKSSELDLPVNGDIIMFVTDRKPMIYVCRLFLCMNADRKYVILQKKEEGEEYYDMAGNVYMEKLRWSLGIVEMKLVPKLLV